MSFEKNLLKVIPELRLYARSRLSNQADADDLVQDTLSRALEKKHLFRGGSLVGWVIILMKNINIDNYRKNGSIDFVNADDTELSSPKRNFSDYLDVNEALLTLSEQCREILVLFGGGHSYKEISDKLRLQHGTVMSRLSRCREQLMSVLNKS